MDNTGYTPEQKAFQEAKYEADFRYQTNQRLQSLEGIIIGKLDRIVAQIGSNKVDCDDAIVRVKNDVEESIKRLSGRLDDFDKRISRNIDMCNQLRKYVDSECANAIDVTQRIDSLVEAHAEIKSSTASHIRDVHREIHDQANVFDARLTQTRNEICARPDGVANLRKDFTAQIDTMALNSTNAQLKSNNNERHLELLDKKIENIYQLIKRLELR